MKEQALTRYQSLAADRQQFLDTARDCAELTLPYLVVNDGQTKGGKLPVPWQSLGAKGCNVLASKLMLSLFPVNTSFFKLQINDAELSAVPDITPEIRSEVDLSLSKMEKIIMQQIAETSDRVMLHTAMKHLVVTGNVLIFVGKKALKVYPLDRYVCVRDGNGEVIEIITKESTHRSLLPKEFQQPMKGTLGDRDINAPGDDGPKFGTTGATDVEEAEVYTCIKLKDGQFRWHQEVDGKILPGSQSSAPKKLNPWLCLRFNIVESTGEDYGRGRVEEFLGDLKSLEGLMQSLVEGSAAAAKVIFTVAPSSTLKPQSLARAQNGQIIQGRKDDVNVIQVGKTADFKSVLDMIRELTRRLSDAFLILQVRDSERTTSTEVQAVQQELNEQLGGIFGNLTTDLLRPYLDRKLHVLGRSKGMPQLPKDLVTPIVVAGLNGIGRGQDRVALVEFLQTAAQGLGPEALMQYISPEEFLKRLAAASGIDTLNLIKDASTMEQEKQAMKQDMMQSSLVNQAGQLAKSPIGEQMVNGIQQNPEALTQGIQNPEQVGAQAAQQVPPQAVPPI